MTFPYLASRRLVAVVCAALLPLAGCASTQDATNDEARIALLVADINAAVDLTDAQADRVRAILTAEAADRPSGPPPRGGRPGGEAGGQASGPPPGGGREARHAETDRLIEAVLTEEQVERYRAWRASQPQSERPPRREQ